MTQEQKEQLAREYSQRNPWVWNDDGEGKTNISQEIYDTCIAMLNACDEEEERLKTELAKAKNPWRDAKTDPPKEWQDVFAHVPHPLGGDYCKLTYLGNYRWSQDEGEWTTEFTDSTVHWMPIPSVEGGES